MATLEKYKPGVAKHVLLFLAGLLWFCTGLVLLSMAATWLLTAENVNPYLFTAPGALLGLLIHRFGFTLIVDRNLARILPAEGKRCVFSFMPLKSYLLIIIMITLGTVLRHSSIPKPYLAIIYTAIGLALLLSSIRYARSFIMELKERNGHALHSSAQKGTSQE